MVLDTKDTILNNLGGSYYTNNTGIIFANLIDNLTSTSTLGNTSTDIPRQGKKVSGNLVSSSFASSSSSGFISNNNNSNLLTITKSTQFVASCYFAPTNSTSTITKNVYVVGGGER
ncbi:MAG: hypothetical protein ORN85_08320 [Sediminibacterium sp.]|nr:hypothetical protein [Sediminibacterium sp.]